MVITKNESGIVHLALIVAVVVGVVGGTGYMVYKAQGQSSAKNDAAVVPASTLAATIPADVLSADKVRALATAQQPNTAIVGVQLENEHGTLLYKVKLADGKVLTFNAKTGAVVTNTAATELEGTANLPASTTTGITFAKAREIALAQKTGTVQKIELETEEGVLVYSVRFTDGARVDVSAADGTVVATRTASGTSTTVKKSDDNSNASSGSDDSANGTETETEHSTNATDDSSHGGSSNSGSGH